MADSWFCIASIAFFVLLGLQMILRAKGVFVPMAARFADKASDPAKAEEKITRMLMLGFLSKPQADKLLTHYGPETGDPEQSPIGETYTPPQLSKEKTEMAKFTGMKLAAAQPYAARGVRCVQLVTANMELLAEVNDLRSRLGLDPRPEFRNE
jgi:hypothetical protein